MSSRFSSSASDLVSCQREVPRTARNPASPRTPTTRDFCSWTRAAPLPQRWATTPTPVPSSLPRPRRNLTIWTSLPWAAGRTFPGPTTPWVAGVIRRAALRLGWWPGREMEGARFISMSWSIAPSVKLVSCQTLVRSSSVKIRILWCKPTKHASNRSNWA